MNNFIPQAWLYVNFTDILDIQGGTQPPKKEFIYEIKDGFIRLLQIRDFGEKELPTYIKKTKNLKTCNENDILIGRYGASVGKILTGMSGAYNVAIAKVIIPKEINSKFVYYLLKTNFFQIPLKKIERSAQGGFNKEDLSEIEIPLPPIQEQTRIVQKLDTLIPRVENALARLEKIPRILKRFRQAVLAAACSGKLTESFVNSTKNDLKENYSQLNNTRDYKNVLLYNRSDSSEVKIDIPENWEIKKLNEVCEIRGGVTKGRDLSKFKTIKLPYLRVANVQDGFLDLKEIKTIEIKESEQGKYFLKQGDILFTEGGDRDKLGRGTIWNNQIKDCIHQNHIFRARIFSDSNIPEYITIATKSQYSKDYFFDYATQTVNLASINISTLGNLRIPLPPLAEQNEIVRRVEALFKLADRIEGRYHKAKARLDRLQQAILAKAFSGELVPQDPNDEPAEVLLKRILADKEKGGIISKRRKK